jgi:hypothetical protein
MFDNTYIGNFSLAKSTGKKEYTGLNEEKREEDQFLKGFGSAIKIEEMSASEIERLNNLAKHSNLKISQNQKNQSFPHGNIHDSSYKGNKYQPNLIIEEENPSKEISSHKNSPAEEVQHKQIEAWMQNHQHNRRKSHKLKGKPASDYYRKAMKNQPTQHTQLKKEDIIEEIDFSDSEIIQKQKGPYNFENYIRSDAKIKDEPKFTLENFYKGLETYSRQQDEIAQKKNYKFLVKFPLKVVGSMLTSQAKILDCDEFKNLNTNSMLISLV